jgi:hypothetical protein
VLEMIATPEFENEDEELVRANRGGDTDGLI